MKGGSGKIKLGFTLTILLVVAMGILAFAAGTRLG